MDLKPGRELDALIAEKVMGFASLYESGISQSEYNRRRNAISHCPYYSGNITMAWEVVEKMKQLTEYNGKLHSTRDPWITFCQKLAGEDSWFGEAFWNLKPASICLATLKAVGVEI